MTTIYMESGTNEWDESPTIEFPSDTTSDLQAETGMQVQEAIARLNEMTSLRPEGWAQLDTAGRLEALHNVEAVMSEIQGRPSVPVETASLGENTFGGFDGKRIILNEDHLSQDKLPVQEFVDTIVHEGRHAFQVAAINNPALTGNAPEVQEWADNMTNYLPLEQYGQEIYQSQPVEADAWSYADQITRGLYGSN